MAPRGPIILLEYAPELRGLAHNFCFKGTNVIVRNISWIDARSQPGPAPSRVITIYLGRHGLVSSAGHLKSMGTPCGGRNFIRSHNFEMVGAGQSGGTTYDEFWPAHRRCACC
jgi:hypothetical protein